MERHMIRFAIAISAALAAAACVPTTQSFLTAPANPSLSVRDPAYANVTAGVNNYEVTGPKDWIEQNRQVAPGGSQPGNTSTSGARRAR